MFLRVILGLSIWLSAYSAHAWLLVDFKQDAQKAMLAGIKNEIQRADLYYRIASSYLGQCREYRGTDGAGL